MPDRSESSKPAFDFSSLLLLILLAVLSGAALQAANWTDDLSIVLTLSLLGVILGTALARSQFPYPVVLAFAAVYGGFALVWQSGLTLDPGLAWRDRTIDLLGRLREQVEALRAAAPHRDPLMFVMALGCAYYLASVRAAWLVFRQGRFWGAVLPLGLALLVNLYVYAGLRRLDVYLFGYVLVALWLALRMEIGRRNTEWQRKKAHVPSDVAATVTRSGALIAALLVLIAWNGPAFAESQTAARLWTGVTRPWREARDRMGEAFSGLRGEVVGSREPYGERLRLTEGGEPADALILRVRAETAPRRNGRFYWRARVYDVYNDGVWSSTEGLPVRMEPELGDLPLPQYGSRETITFTFQPEQTGLYTLYLAGQPLWVNRTATARILPVEGFGLDVLQVESAVPIVRGETYRSRGSVAVPLAEELRRSGQVYPQWVVENYLDVPPEISGSLRDHALQISAGADTGFDRALAVTNWLRENIQYSRVIEAPPEGRDPVEWFLFESQVGFCNYYASAEVLLLRSLGIPARLAVGYARGAFNLDEDAYEVRAADAHAWPEVFFPAFGWVEFEPTVSQLPILRPERDPDVEAADASLPPEEQTAGENVASAESPSAEPLVSTPESASWGEILFLFLGWGGLMALGVGILFRVRPQARATAVDLVLGAFRLAGFNPPKAIAAWRPYPQSPLARIYAEWSAWLRRLEVPILASQTPNERVQAFALVYPEGEPAARVMVEAYNRERFSHQSVRNLDGLAAWDGLERELRQIWWASLRQRWIRRLRSRRVGARPGV